jgi:hypothetical protein
MFSGNERYLSILVSAPMLLGCVAMILSTIALLKKSKRYGKFARRLMIALLIVAFGINVYLVYLAFEYGNSHTSATPLPLQ